MGIKQFFEQQPEKQDNIRDIKIEAPKEKRGFEFDVHELVSEAEWEAMKEKLEEWRKGGDWYQFSSLISQMKIIFPERVADLRLNDGEIWPKAKKMLDEIPNRPNVAYCYYFFFLKKLFPEQIQQISLDNTYWQRLKNALAEWIKDEEWWAFLEDYQVAKSLFPKKVSDFIRDDNIWDQIVAKANLKRHQGQWEMFAKYASMLRLFNPRAYSNLKCARSDWDAIKKYAFASGQAKRDPVVRADLVVAMKVLSSQKVEFTEHELKLTMDEPEEFREEREPRPVRLSF